MTTDYETTPGIQGVAWVEEKRRTAVEAQAGRPGGGNPEVGEIPRGGAPGPGGLRWGKLGENYL